MKRLIEADKHLVYKGFRSIQNARDAYYAARNSGVIDAIQKGAGRQYWSVTEGVNPAVYENV